MTMIPINEIFDTVQGEATYTGAPSVFIRTQGCDVGCPWCDTKHTWAVDENRLGTLQEILQKTDNTDRYALASPLELVEHCRPRARHIVITGGEPCDHDLTELTAALHNSGKTVQVETSGTRPIRVDVRTWVTVSPKINMPGGYRVLNASLLRASEIKMPVGKMADIDLLQVLLGSISAKPLVWLQPLSMNPKATALCIEMATKHGWRISVQVHKYLGVR